jgi:hypothetical protein
MKKQEDCEECSQLYRPGELRCRTCLGEIHLETCIEWGNKVEKLKDDLELANGRLDQAKSEIEDWKRRRETALGVAEREGQKAINFQIRFEKSEAKYAITKDKLIKVIRATLEETDFCYLCNNHSSGCECIEELEDFYD